MPSTSDNTIPSTVRIGMLSLGCPKTLVDSETILGKLNRPGMTLADSVADCDVALLNTCAFIQDAQQESVERILELVDLKKEQKIKAVVVMGCLVQRFSKDLRRQLRDVDAFVGSGDYDKIPQIVDRVLGGRQVVSVGRPGYLQTAAEGRVALTPGHYRYLKISEGCDHICTFCVIPKFRGKHRSRPQEDILTESRALIQSGAREIIVTGQDTTYYGRDFTGNFMLPELLKALDGLEGAPWIRLLYAYPSCITTELMETIQRSKNICHYLDMPLQHASDRMLLAMRRGITQRRTEDLISEFRERIPDLAIRTTFIVGFPGETEEDFEELLAFMERQRFERVGIFTYSREQGSAAAGLAHQVPEKVKAKRLERAMLLQQRISKENNQKWLGKSLAVIIDAKDDSAPHRWVGRSYMDAPEVDGNVFIESTHTLAPGQRVTATITDFREYDLVGRL